MSLFRRWFLAPVAILVPWWRDIWDIGKWLIDWGGRAQFVSDLWPMLRDLPLPSQWLVWPGLVIGLLLIWWDTRRIKIESLRAEGSVPVPSARERVRKRKSKSSSKAPWVLATIVSLVAIGALSYFFYGASKRPQAADINAITNFIKTNFVATDHSAKFGWAYDIFCERCGDTALELRNALKTALGWESPDLPLRPIFPGLATEGIKLMVPDVHHPPLAAQMAKVALEAGGVHVRFHTDIWAPPEGEDFVLYVGRQN